HSVLLAPATSHLYTLSLHDALPIFGGTRDRFAGPDDYRSDWHVSMRSGRTRFFERGRHPFQVLGRGNHVSISASRSHREGPLKRSEEHTSELQSRSDLVCRLLLEKK